MTYAFILNYEAPTEGQFIWRMKEALVAAGWSVPRSGDGTIFSNGDVHAPGGPYAGSLDVTNAWLELRQPSAATPRRSLLLQKTSTAGAWRCWYASVDISGSGVGDSIAFVSGTTYRLTDATAAFVAGDVGKTLVIAGATSPGNNGNFVITAQAGTTVDYVNAAGVAEAYTGTWRVLASDGFKWGITGTGDSIAFVAGTTYRLTDAGAAFVAGDVGKTLRITGATSPGNNGDFVITAQTGTTVDYVNAAGVAEAYAGAWYVSRDGTATVRSLASDEQGIFNTPAGTTTWLSTTSLSDISNIIVGDAAENYSFIFMTYSRLETGIQTILALDVLDQAHPLDLDPAIVMYAMNADGTQAFEQNSPILSGQVASQTAGRAKGWYQKTLGGQSFTIYQPGFWGAIEGGANNLVSLLQRLGTAASNAFPELPVWYWRGGSVLTTQQGKKGRSHLFKSVNANLGFFRSRNDRLRMGLRALSIPWDGATVPRF